MKKLISIIIVATVILAGCSKKDSTLDVVLDYTPNTNHIGLYVANKLGYYKEQDVDVNIIQSTQVSAETLVSSKKADIGYSYQENISMARDKNLDVTSIYAIFNNNSSGFLSHSDKNITRPKDFENKNYCGWGSDVESAIVKQVAKNDGADPSSITIKNISTGFLNTSKEECDFFWEFEGWNTTKVKLAGVEYNYIPITDYNLDFYTPVLFTNSKTDKILLQKFITATNKGYQYAIDNPKDAAQILVDEVPELEYELVYQSLITITPNINKSGYQSDSVWNIFSQWLIDNKIVSDEFNYKDAYNNDLIKGE